MLDFAALLKVFHATYMHDAMFHGSEQRVGRSEKPSKAKEELLYNRPVDALADETGCVVYSAGMYLQPMRTGIRGMNKGTRAHVIAVTKFASH